MSSEPRATPAAETGSGPGPFAAPGADRGRVAIGVDLGGTKLAAALVTDAFEVLVRHRVSTPGGGPHAVVEAIADVVTELRASEAVAVGIGAPGPVSNGVVATAPNLPGWESPVPLASLVGQRLGGLPVAVGNDANVGTYGEWAAGAGRGARALLGVWPGTGVGGGLVLDGRLYDGVFGGAGELGHVIVRQGGRRCGCGRLGCLEAYAGRASMERRVHEEVARGADTSLLELQERKGKTSLTAGVWAKALDDGDPLAVRIVDDMVGALAAGVGSTINLLDLDRVVFGGGMTEKLGQPFVDRVAAATRPYTILQGVPREFVAATLADDAGVVGAAAMALGTLPTT